MLTVQQLKDILREGAMVTHGDAWVLAERVHAALQSAPQEPATSTEQEPMTAERAAFFLRRFEHDEKMLGPNERGALDFAIAALAPEAGK